MRDAFRNGLINMTVHLFTFIFSILAIPISVVTIVIASLNTDYMKRMGDTGKQYIGLLLLVTGSADILLIVLPYITSATIVKHFLTESLANLLWYHSVVIPMTLFPALSTFALFQYVDSVITAVKYNWTINLWKTSNNNTSY